MKKTVPSNYQKQKVLILGGNTDQLPYIKELKRRGFWLALTDINEFAPARSYVDKFATIGYEDDKKLMDFATEIGLSVDDHIFTAAAQFAHLSCALVAEGCGIAYPAYKTIKMCLDKSRYYSEFQQYGIPIPHTSYISNFNELKNLTEKLGVKNTYYLKSDYSKNPKYVYRFNGESLEEKSFFWGRDRYLREFYILQKEVTGRHLRLNLFPDGYTAFNFFDSSFIEIKESDDILGERKIIEKLRYFLKCHNLTQWLVKFDLIISSTDWVALDIGLDPPMRMKAYVESNGGDFIKNYIDMYTNKQKSAFSL